jgi:hypothetical protein
MIYLFVLPVIVLAVGLLCTLEDCKTKPSEKD